MCSFTYFTLSPLTWLIRKAICFHSLYFAPEQSWSSSQFSQLSSALKMYYLALIKREIRLKLTAVSTHDGVFSTNMLCMRTHHPNSTQHCFPLASLEFQGRCWPNTCGSIQKRPKTLQNASLSVMLQRGRERLVGHCHRS